MFKYLPVAVSLLLAVTCYGDPLPGSPLENVDCSVCHLITSTNSNSNANANANPRARATAGVPADTADQISDAQELLCGDCHQDALVNSHISGFIPDRSLPPEHPLDWTGFLTCSSCHWIHEPGHGVVRKLDPTTDSCIGCHDY